MEIRSDLPVLPIRLHEFQGRKLSERNELFRPRNDIFEGRKAAEQARIANVRQT